MRAQVEVLDSDSIKCEECGDESPEWVLIAFDQPPGMPRKRACASCWAEAAADVWEAEEADRLAAESSAGHTLKGIPRRRAASERGIPRSIAAASAIRSRAWR